MATKKLPTPGETVIDKRLIKDKITDSKGKKHTVTTEETLTVPKPADTLYKLAPLIYISPQSKMIYFIPFSIPFTFEEFFKWLIDVQRRLTEVIDIYSKDHPDEKKN